MNADHAMPEDLNKLLDDYVDGTLDEAGLEALEERLRVDEESRAHFVRYCRMHTDLELESRARRAGQRALRTIAELAPAPVTTSRGHSRRWWLALAAAVVAALGLWWWSASRDGQAQDEIAWLTNAQDCQWADNQAPAGDMRVGKVLRLERGLAEIRFQSGARLVLEGPATLQLLGGKSARLLHGKLAAHVPPSAKGFQITSPHGRVVDLGTEFGMAVAKDGTTDVYVFTGKVDAYADAATDRTAVSVQEKQAARIDATGVALQPAVKSPESNQFVRAIVPAPKIVPRVFGLDFRQAVAGTLLDAAGMGTGFTHRLPGTGKRLLNADKNLRLDLEEGRLELTTTNTDLNTSFRLDWGEYLGVRLSDLGFTGKEDFAITVAVPDIPELPHVGQFGLYAALDSRQSIRGGMISTKEPKQYRQFIVENREGEDAPPKYVGVGFPGDDLRLTLKREGQHFTLTVENQKTGSTSLRVRQPDFLEGEKDLKDLDVGFFGANTQSNVQRTLKLKEFQVTVWTVPGS
jgi:hypothetical protein